MNYRHIYHAGNAADVFKHAVLALLLRRLAAKDTPFAVLDTHAGVGVYDLARTEAQRTGEFRDGIARLLAVYPASMPDEPVLAPYLAMVRAGLDETGALIRYPGSPAITRAALRPGDRLVLCELHPDDHAALRRSFAGDRQVAVHHMDGYRALRAHLPPKERRGLVLIDPPYEDAGELARLPERLAQAWHRWPTGAYALWYPIKERPAIWRFHEALIAEGIRRMLAVELTVRDEVSHATLNGSGMILVNPPWQLDQELERLLPLLHGALAHGGDTRVEWLAGE